MDRSRRKRSPHLRLPAERPSRSSPLRSRLDRLVNCDAPDGPSVPYEPTVSGTSRYRDGDAGTRPHATLGPVSLISIGGLTKRYGGVTALDGLTVDIEPGIVGLVGSNGAGKSTLLKILLGLIGATSGSATVFDLDVATRGIAIRELVGYMPEHDCLPPDMSATDVVSHPTRIPG